MKFIIKRELILKPLQKISNIISGKKTLDILNNLLLIVKKKYIKLIGTNLEVEIKIKILSCNIYETGNTTVLARKFFDICRSFPISSNINILTKNSRLFIFSNRTNFYLSTISENNFPKIEKFEYKLKLIVNTILIKKLIKYTKFSMANNDIRYYLNGMLFEIYKNKIKSVTTDGHRLSISSMLLDKVYINKSIIVPKNSIKELIRLLDETQNNLKIKIGDNNVSFKIGNCILVSKLIEGIYPDYNNICSIKYKNYLKANRNKLKESLSRVSILSNEIFKGVRLYINKNQIKITSNNSLHEEAEEFLNVFYEGEKIEICLNSRYILDILNTLSCEDIIMLFNDDSSSIKIKEFLGKNSEYIIMPMKL